MRFLTVRCKNRDAWTVRLRQAQDSTKYAILPSQMKEHGVSSEIMENMENMEKMKTSTSWHKTFCFWLKGPIPDSKHSLLQHLQRWLKITKNTTYKRT